MKMLWICAKQNYCVKCLNYNTYVISLLGYVMHNICIVTAAFKKLDLSYCSHCIPFFFSVGWPYRKHFTNIVMHFRTWICKHSVAANADLWLVAQIVKVGKSTFQSNNLNELSYWFFHSSNRRAEALFRSAEYELNVLVIRNIINPMPTFPQLVG